MDRSGVVTRAASGQPVPVPDCEAWKKEADPLWRYHEAVSEHDCVGDPYAPKHPCSAALAKLCARERTA